MNLRFYTKDENMLIFRAVIMNLGFTTMVNLKTGFASTNQQGSLYKREIDYNRAITLRNSKINRLIIEIYASKVGKSWHDIIQEKRKLLRKQNPLSG